MGFIQILMGATKKLWFFKVLVWLLRIRAQSEMQLLKWRNVANYQFNSIFKDAGRDIQKTLFIAGKHIILINISGVRTWLRLFG